MAVRMVRGADGRLRRGNPIPDTPDEPIISEHATDLGLLNVPQAAKALGVSERTLRNWCSARKIPFIKVGARVLFEKEDLKIWIQKRKVGANVIEK